MSNAIYPLYKQNLLAGTAGYDLDNDTTTDGPYAVLIDTAAYVYSTAHQFYSSLTGIVGTEQRITAPTVANGVFKGGNLLYMLVSGPTIEAIVGFRKNAGANTTWPLFMYYDTGGVGLPATPNGGNIAVTWDSQGIFQL